MALLLPLPVDSPESHTDRRWAVWRASMPLFAKHGFRGVTVEQLAYASAMSPATLYHYFPNKTAIALFPLSHGNGLCEEWEARAAALPDDPIVRLREMIEFAIDHVDDWRLSIVLAGQMRDDAVLEQAARRQVAEARRDFLSMARSIDPTIREDRALDLHASFTAILASDLPLFDHSREGLRRRLVDLVRGWLAAQGADPTRL